VEVRTGANLDAIHADTDCSTRCSGCQPATVGWRSGCLHCRFWDRCGISRLSISVGRRDDQRIPVGSLAVFDGRLGFALRENQEPGGILEIHEGPRSTLRRQQIVQVGGQLEAGFSSSILISTRQISAPQVAPVRSIPSRHHSRSPSSCRLRCLPALDKFPDALVAERRASHGTHP
jgi:hypothetical protein